MVRFAELLEMVAAVNPDLRVRFSTSHPKDMTDDVLHAMSRHENICKYIHLPVQSGHSDVLKRMNRGYARVVPRPHRSHPSHHARLCHQHRCHHWLLRRNAGGARSNVELDGRGALRMAFMFKYSERPKTLAERKFDDDVPEDVKGARLQKSSPVKWCMGRNVRKPLWGRSIAS